VIATFFNFNPALVHRALPRAWSVASPEQILAARLAGADAALRRTCGALLDEPSVARAATLARRAAEACPLPGRPLFAGHASLPWPEAPHLELWHAITLLREYRGDGHVACLTEAGLDGLDALVLHAASGEVPRSILQATRGWDDGSWDAAVGRLAERGVVDGAGGFTPDGAELRRRIEERTDELALTPWRAIGAEACHELRAAVRPSSKAIVTGGGLSPDDLPELVSRTVERPPRTGDS